MKKIVTCGAVNTDFPGYDNMSIQKAIDYAASFGGGEVFCQKANIGLWILFI